MFNSSGDPDDFFYFCQGFVGDGLRSLRAIREDRVYLVRMCVVIRLSLLHGLQEGDNSIGKLAFQLRVGEFF